MERRIDALQSFVDAASAAFGDAARDEASRRAVGRVFDSLESPRPGRAGAGRRLPACEHLERALAVEAPRPALGRLVESFARVEPLLEWRRRASDATASDNFPDGHANAMIIGPGGCEDRRDVWLGVTLMAPRVRYPDHDHVPEEVYLVLSEGEFRQGSRNWFSPGIGGSFYNEPGIRHAMRSLDEPLFAFWALRASD